eukprot:3240967-Rhodomonas_salina.2
MLVSSSTWSFGQRHSCTAGARYPGTTGLKLMKATIVGDETLTLQVELHTGRTFPDSESH